MKKVLLIFLLCLTILPFSVNAETKKYNTLNLDEALTQENIEHDFSNYKETDKQITIYLFRGNGCHFCQDFLNFLNSIVDEYGKYFKVVSYETWYDRNNYDLMTEVSTFLGQPSTGVPYIIIGDQVFGGYSSNYDDAIKKAITDLYNSKDRYDVFEEMEKAKKEAAKASKPINYSFIIISNLAIVIIALGTILYTNKMQNKSLLSKLNDIEGKLNHMENELKPVKVTEDTTEKSKTKKKSK